MGRPVLTVVGSIHYDRTVRVTEHPGPGETKIATLVQAGLGGKGANQALAAVAMGAPVAFVGKVGSDEVGGSLREALHDHGVDTSLIQVAPGQPSGGAFISLDLAGENIIYVIPGANGTMTPSDVAEGVRRSAGRGDIVLSQGELPIEAVEAGMLATRSAGARYVLNLAPFIPVGADVIRSADPLIVNEVEANAALLHLTGKEFADGSQTTMLERGHELASSLSQHATSVIVTLGAEGAVVGEHGRTHHTPAQRVSDVVDTSGAGDTFVGAVTAVLLSGGALREAVESGVRAGAEAISHSGANRSLWSEAGADTVEALSLGQHA